MTIFMLWMGLTTLSFNMTYTAEEVNCDQGQITVVLHEQSFPVSLFNVQVNEQGKQKACELINQAQVVTFEIDDHVDILQPTPVWLFCDGILLQKTLIEQDGAVISINNPDYTYHDQLQKANQKSVFSNTASGVIRQYQRRRGEVWIGTLSFLIAGLILLQLTLYSRRKRQKNEK